MLWTDGSVLFPFGKDGSGVLANCSLCGTEATFFFQQAQYAQVFSLKPAPFCKLFTSLGSANMSATSLLLLSDYHSVLSSIFSFTLISGRKCFFSPVPIRLQLVSGHSFFPGNNSADELARRGALLVSSAIPCILSPFISRIHSCLFTDLRHTVPSKFFDPQVPSISTEEFVLLRHARCVLFRLRCNGHSLLLSSYLTRIGRIENPSCNARRHPSQDTSHLILPSPATD